MQFYFKTSLGPIVKAEMFTPPPKIDSQVVILSIKDELPISSSEIDGFFRLVKAGFSERRKKLRSSLSGGLGISKQEAEKLLSRAGINPNSRAQELSIDSWLDLRRQYT
jgi:16S rRNA (adenine1518-N6/adenine1519-N6)-dimethyltransferase